MSDTSLETSAFERLQCDSHCKAFAKEWINAYRAARDAVYPLLNQWAKHAAPDLTDHGEAHVRDVFGKAHELFDGQADLLPPADSMQLICTILYHDVGNLTGREEHQKRIGEVFGDTWPKGQRKWARLSANVIQAGGAHAGKTSDGSDDTLMEVSRHEPGEFGPLINLQNVAAITRFADETAEGPQRTHRYMVDHKLIGEDNGIYHEYAAMTTVSIDRGNGRIVLKYDIDLDTTNVTKLKKLLQMAYGRIMKLNWERQLPRHYWDPLSCFKQTEASFSFSQKGLPVDWNRAPIVLTDIGLIGKSPVKDLGARFKQYEISQVVRDIQSIRKGSK